MIAPPFSVPRSPRYLSLDMWRGIACLFVILYHSVLVYLGNGAPDARPLSAAIIEALHQLNVGVILFFVISGYCIAAAADNARRNQSAMRQYFIRRFRRIYPPLWVVTALAILFFVVVDVVALPGALSSPPWPQLRPWWYSPSQWFGNITLTETWRHYFWGTPRGHFPGQAWTLCYEEQFYAVMGFLLLFPKHLFKGVVAVTLLTLGAMSMARVTGTNVEGYFFDGNWLTFAAGILVYVHINYLTSAHKRISFALLGISLVLAWPFGIVNGQVAFGFALLLICLHRFDGAIATSRLTMPLMWCGQMCYSLYLVHQLVVKGISYTFFSSGFDSGLDTLLVTVPSCVIASVVCGRAFYLTVERRFLNAKQRTEAASPTLPAPAVVSA